MVDYSKSEEIAAEIKATDVLSTGFECLNRYFATGIQAALEPVQEKFCSIESDLEKKVYESVFSQLDERVQGIAKLLETGANTEDGKDLFQELIDAANSIAQNTGLISSINDTISNLQNKYNDLVQDLAKVKQDIATLTETVAEKVSFADICARIEEGKADTASFITSMARGMLAVCPVVPVVPDAPVEPDAVEAPTLNA